MKSRMFSTILNVNSVFQALSCLISPIAIGALVSWLLTRNNVVGPWIYAVLIPVGAVIGLISMIGYLLKVAETEKAMRMSENKDTGAEPSETSPAKETDPND